MKFRNWLKSNCHFGLTKIEYFSKTSSYQINWKKDKDKRLIKNWRSISLLNVDPKLIEKVLAENLKTALFSLISANQMAYLSGRFISLRMRLISNVFKATDLLKLKGPLQTVDIEKAFDTKNRNFSIKSNRKVWL